MDQKSAQEISFYNQENQVGQQGENRILQAKTDQQNLGIKFEFIAPGTPQQNSVVERKFPTLMGRARAMMNHAGFDDNYKKKFWCEAISTATKLNNIMVKHMGGTSLLYVLQRKPKIQEISQIFWRDCCGSQS